MSLRSDYTGIKNWEEVCWEKGDDGTTRLNVITEILVFATIPCGMPSITEKNVDEFYARLTMVQMLPIVIGGEAQPGKGYVIEVRDDGMTNRFVTKDEVRQHIGLRTNASGLTRAGFMNSQVKGALDSLAGSFRKEVVSP